MSQDEYEGNDVRLPPGYAWGEQPQVHGVGVDRQLVAKGRAVLLIPGRVWPQTPATCTARVSEWVLSDQVLVCLGCGLDGT